MRYSAKLLIGCANTHTGTFSVTNIGNTVAVHYAVSATVYPPTISGRTMLPGGSFELSFSGTSGQTFKVVATNVVNAPLASWPVLTNGTFGAGPASFTDTANIQPVRFYRIVSP